MNITPQQARAAFYDAAANIEARPELYDFMATQVGEGDCPACMWGHVGRVMGLRSDMYVSAVANITGVFDTDLYDFESPASDGISFDALRAAAHMRAFADAQWPPECGQSFTQLMESMSERVL